MRMSERRECRVEHEVGGGRDRPRQPGAPLRRSAVGHAVGIPSGITPASTAARLLVGLRRADGTPGPRETARARGGA